MHARFHHSTIPPRRDRQGWWCLTWRLGAVLALGLALTSPSPGQAKTFRCDAGDVQCLIDAIHEANANGQKNTIRLAAGTYTLTTVNNNTAGPNGLPSITSRLTIQGTGAAHTQLERAFLTGSVCDPTSVPAFRLLHVAPTGVVVLKGITLRGGCIDGLELDNFLGGGGVFNQGTLTVLHSAIIENMTVGTGPPGAGVRSQGTLTVIDSTIADNEALGEGGGGIHSDGILTVTRSRIADNSGDSAGGIDTRGFTVIEHSSIVDNTGHFAGGIVHSGPLYITDSTIARNNAAWVGGIDNEEPESTLTIINSTIAENASLFLAGGINNQGGTLTILNSTIARNKTSSPDFSFGSVSAGIGNIPTFSSDIVGTVTLLNTILAQNTFDEPPSSSSGGPDCGGPITSFGTNLIGDPTGCDIALQASDLTGDPGLGALTDNGRPGHGHVPLLPTSQAIDAGNDAVCPRRDQLGQRRVNIPGVGTSRCDIGAVEFQHRDKHHDDKDHDEPHTAPAPVAQATP